LINEFSKLELSTSGAARAPRAVGDTSARWRRSILFRMTWARQGDQESVSNPLSPQSRAAVVVGRWGDPTINVRVPFNFPLQRLVISPPVAVLCLPRKTANQNGSAWTTLDRIPSAGCGSWREYNRHDDMLVIRLDKILDENERKWLRVRSMPLDTLGLVDLTKSVAIPHPSGNDTRSWHATREMLLICCRRLLDQNKGRSLFDQQSVHGGADRA
jgi:hypothetical protein